MPPASPGDLEGAACALDPFARSCLGIGKFQLTTTVKPTGEFLPNSPRPKRLSAMSRLQLFNRRLRNGGPIFKKTGGERPDLQIRV